MTCGHANYERAWEAGPECELAAAQRNEVYVFALSSLNPISILALDDLREQLNRQGYAKIATGQTIHAGWMGREMRRIREAAPDATFVVVGFESAGSTAIHLAEKAAREGLAVDGVVLINSEGAFPSSPTGLRVIRVGKVSEMDSGRAETVAVDYVASHGLASDTRTVEAVGRLLQESASAVTLPSFVEASEWSYPYAPSMRVDGDPARAPDWAFLFDSQPSSSPPADTPTPAPPPFVPPTTSGVILRSAIR